MTAPHVHELDGTLHDGCPMCDDIRSRYEGARRDRDADAAAARHCDRAARSRRGRDILATNPPEVDL